MCIEKNRACFVLNRITDRFFIPAKKWMSQVTSGWSLPWLNRSILRQFKSVPHQTQLRATVSHASYRVPSCGTYVSYSLCPAYGAMITQRQSCPFAILSMSFIRIAHPIVYLSYNDYNNYNGSDLDLDLDCYKWGWLVDMMSARSVFHSKVFYLYEIGLF